jgi:hypothetical protein
VPKVSPDSLECRCIPLQEDSNSHLKASKEDTLVCNHPLSKHINSLLSSHINSLLNSNTSNPQVDNTLLVTQVVPLNTHLNRISNNPQLVNILLVTQVVRQ